MNKKIIFIIMAGAPVFILGVFFLFFSTYTISGKVTDLASKEAIAGVELSVGNVVVTTNNEGEFKIENLKKYQSNFLKIKTPTGYEEVTPIHLESGKEDIQNIEIVPTLETMVTRINDAARNTQHDYLWDYMHPDDQEYWGSREKYVTTFKKVNEIKKELGVASVSTIEIGKNIRKLDSWKHEITEKEYADVMEVPVEAKVGENKSEIDLLYFQKKDGVWRYFTQKKKEEYQTIIDEYEKWKSLFSD